MKLLTFYENDTLKLGLVTDLGVVDLAAHLGDATLTPDALYHRGSDALEELVERTAGGVKTNRILDEAELMLGPAVPNPGKILCVGLNYRKHAAESGMDEPKQPVLFSKFNNAIAAPDEPVPMPTDWSTVDYEAELVVVIGREAKNVSEADALDYVLGYCNGNDISERNLQFTSGQWLLGKTPDKFLPIGPYMVTPEEAGDPAAMPIKGWMNGELRQDSNTTDMIFSVREIIAYASQYFTLSPGDIISTGTPEGVILGLEEKVYMRPGDEYTVEIGNLGRLTNKMVEA